MKSTILLVEDNPQNRYLLTFLLESQGYDVCSVADGARAIDAAISLVPDLILLDIQLPTMDGYAVATAIKEHCALRAVPIIAVTSHAMPSDRERATEVGCVGYIEKPIDPETFVDEIAAVMAMSHPPEDV